MYSTIAGLVLYRKWLSIWYAINKYRVYGCQKGSGLKARKVTITTLECVIEILYGSVLCIVYKA